MASEEIAGAEMTAQVTALSTKLLEAIDRQADLEDQIQVMRRELDHSRRENMRYEDRMKTGDLVSQSAVALERVKRIQAEQQAAKLQGEIEELTSSLFDEANKMVAQANRETSDREKRNDQLQQQLKERDVLLEDMQAQLSALKMVLQDMTDQQVDIAPRSAEEIDIKDEMEASLSEPIGIKSIPLAPASVYRPVVRHDMQNFHEFLMMVPPPQASPRTSVIMTAVDSSITSERGSPAHMNYDTGSTTPIGSASASPVNHTPTNSTGKVTSTGTNISTLTSRFQSITSNSNSTPGLKDFKFFKKSFGDDIEPTLHLETAPGLSWLSRRNIMSSILDGSIIVEPIAAANEGYKLTVAGADDESLAPEYLNLTKSISGGSTNTIQTVNGGAQEHSAYMPLNQPNYSAYFMSSNGQKIKAHLTGGTGTGAPLATRTPCAFCGEKRDSSLLYARLHNLRSGKEKKGHENSSNNNKESNRHGYHMSSDSIGSHVSTTNDDKNSIDNNSIESDASSIHTVPGGFPGSTGTQTPSTVSSGYPLCYYCLNRVRTVCDYVSFVRSIRAGLWKIEDEASQIRAWEECILLRERMFWARNGGYFLIGETGQPLDARSLVGISGGSFGSGSYSGGGMISRRQTLSRLGTKFDDRSREDVTETSAAKESQGVVAVDKGASAASAIDAEDPLSESKNTDSEIQEDTGNDELSLRTTPDTDETVPKPFVVPAIDGAPSVATSAAAVTDSSDDDAFEEALSATTSPLSSSVQVSESVN